MQTLSLFLMLLFLTLRSIAAPHAVDFLSITKLMVENGCDEQNVQSDRVHLNKKSSGSNDLLVFCASDCGAQQCSYSVYLQSKNNYIFSGQFFGRYEILPSEHKGFFDIQNILKNPQGEKIQKTLQLKGSIYR